MTKTAQNFKKHKVPQAADANVGHKWQTPCGTARESMPLNPFILIQGGGLKSVNHSSFTCHSVFSTCPILHYPEPCYGPRWACGVLLFPSMNFLRVLCLEVAVYMAPYGPCSTAGLYICLCIFQSTSPISLSQSVTKMQSFQRTEVSLDILKRDLRLAPVTTVIFVLSSPIL